MPPQDDSPNSPTEAIVQDFQDIILNNGPGNLPQNYNISININSREVSINGRNYRVQNNSNDIILLIIQLFHSIHTEFNSITTDNVENLINNLLNIQINDNMRRRIENNLNNLTNETRNTIQSLIQTINNFVEQGQNINNNDQFISFIQGLGRLYDLIYNLLPSSQRNRLRQYAPVMKICYSRSTLQRFLQTFDTTYRDYINNNNCFMLLLLVIYAYYAKGSVNVSFARRGRWLPETIISRVSDDDTGRFFLSTCPSKEDAALILYYLILRYGTLQNNEIIININLGTSPRDTVGNLFCRLVAPCEALCGECPPDRTESDEERTSDSG